MEILQNPRRPIKHDPFHPRQLPQKSISWKGGEGGDAAAHSGQVLNVVVYR